MIVFIVLHILFILFLVGAIALDMDDHYVLKIVSIILCGLLLIPTCVSDISLVIAWIDKDGYTAKCQQRYEALYAQAYCQMYENDNDYGKKQLADQIMEWNEDVEAYKIRHHSSLISIYYPVDIDQFKTIPIGLLEGTVG